MITTRIETRGDHDAVRILNAEAFSQPDEGRIVDALRRACPETVSRVALADETPVGHLLFSPATVQGPDGPVIGMGLAPMAVRPDFQRQGIGSRLVQEGLEDLASGGCPFVIVLGHPEFYPRFGFRRASAFGLRCQWDGVPDEAFMALILKPEALQGISDVVRYRPEFDAAL